jgi:opacity protein-like surface antigen
MRKLIFACAILSGSLMTSLVSAQDCGYTPQSNPYCCGGSFDGFYVGGNLGVASHVAHRNDLDGFFIVDGPAGWTFISTNVTAGVQLGYDWQCCNKLFGLVIDWNWVNTQVRNRIEPNTTSTDFHINSDFNWFTTIRARGGLTICDTLFYVTGGAAVARHKNTWISGNSHFNDNHTRWGWVAGAGAEWLLFCNWSVGAEFLWLQFSEHTRTLSPADYAFGHSDQGYIGRILLNYRFGDFFCCN